MWIGRPSRKDRVMAVDCQWATWSNLRRHLCARTMLKFVFLWRAEVWNLLLLCLLDTIYQEFVIFNILKLYHHFSSLKILNKFILLSSSDSSIKLTLPRIHVPLLNFLKVFIYIKCDFDLWFLGSFWLPYLSPFSSCFCPFLCNYLELPPSSRPQ